jgi:nuclear protein localization family protein 4
MVDGHIQDFNALSSYMQQFAPDCFLQAVSDFHFLLYISTMDMLPMKVCRMSNIYMRGLTNNWTDSVIYLFRLGWVMFRLG